jgi:hypothetical protein
LPSPVTPAYPLEMVATGNEQCFDPGSVFTIGQKFCSVQKIQTFNPGEEELVDTQTTFLSPHIVFTMNELTDG